MELSWCVFGDDTLLNLEVELCGDLGKFEFFLLSEEEGGEGRRRIGWAGRVGLGLGL